VPANHRPFEKSERSKTIENEASDSAGVQEVSYPRFAAFYNWLMSRPLVRRMFDPLRREIINQAQGVVLEVEARTSPSTTRPASSR
jgi:hypothetical protein